MITLENENKDVRLRQGTWTSKAGLNAYVRPTLKHSAHVSPLLHDLNVCPTTVLQNLFTTQQLPSISPSPPSGSSPSGL